MERGGAWPLYPNGGRASTPRAEFRGTALSEANVALNNDGGAVNTQAAYTGPVDANSMSDAQVRHLLLTNPTIKSIVAANLKRKLDVELERLRNEYGHNNARNNAGMQFKGMRQVSETQEKNNTTMTEGQANVDHMRAQDTMLVPVANLDLHGDMAEVEGQSMATADEAVESSPAKRVKVDHAITPFYRLPADEFCRKVQLYDGPKASIVVGPTEKKTYEVPKALLKNASLYFRAAFDGRSREGTDEKFELSCISAAFDLVVQYMYLGSFNLPYDLSRPQCISALLDFYMLADKLLLNVLERIERVMRGILTASNDHLKPEHIRKAIKELPPGSPIRKLFANASIRSFLLNTVSGHSRQDPNFYGTESFKFQKEYQELEGYAADLLKAHVEVAANRGELGSFSDPLTGASFSLI